MVAVAENHIQGSQVGGMALDDATAAPEGGPYDLGIDRVGPCQRF
jgi:hypothetical protein